MKFLANTTKVLGLVWLGAVALLIFASLVMIGVKDGFFAVVEILSPYNVVNYLVTLLVAAPGIGLLILSDKLTEKIALAHGKAT